MHVWRVMVVLTVILLTTFLQLRLDSQRRDVQEAHPGFTVVVTVKSKKIAPALEKLGEYRTSQLAYVQGRIHNSRKVLYVSKHKSPLKVVLIVPLDANSRFEDLVRLLDEREHYARCHGYGIFARYIQDFAVENLPATEALRLASIRMLRQAMVAFPQATWFWYLQSSGRILNHEIVLDQLLQQRLDNEMLREVPVRPLESEGALTSRVARACDTAIVVSRNSGGLDSSSILVRSSIVAKALLELMLDPINQNYPAFQKDEDHAGALMTHLAEWHPQLLSRFAVVPPHFLGCGPSCNKGDLACSFDPTKERVDSNGPLADKRL